MNPFHIVENNNVNILYQWFSLVVGGKEFCLPADNMSGDLFFLFVMMWVSGWVGERWFVTGLQWVESGNAGKHSTMHGTGLWFLCFYLLVKESAVFVFWPYR